MNERIQELADKAGRFRSHNGGINGGPNPALLYGDENIQKFAELIVRECAGLVQGVPTDSMGYHTADQKIKEHFGV